MKRITIGIVSGIVLIALILGVLPVAASESEGNITEIGSYLSQLRYYPNTISGSTVTKHDRSPSTTQVGEHLTFTVSATDPDNDSLIYSASNLPPGATFDPQTRTFSWTPGYDQAGVYPNVHFEVSDGELTDFEEITITVNANAEKTPEEAIFSVNSLRVRPAKVNAGKQVRISVLATNIGTVAGSYEVTLRINGIIEDNKIVNLSPGTTEEVNFIIVKDIAGVYTVDINGLSDSFVVREADKGRGRAKTVSINSILSKTVGWIRMILQEGGDA
jgi:hypothetical protein